MPGSNENLFVGGNPLLFLITIAAISAVRNIANTQQITDPMVPIVCFPFLCVVASNLQAFPKLF